MLYWISSWIGIGVICVLILILLDYRDGNDIIVEDLLYSFIALFGPILILVMFSKFIENLLLKRGDRIIIKGKKLD